MAGIATIAVGTSPWGLTTGLGAVWVVNAKDDTVMRIDPERARVTATVAVGHNPKAVAVAGFRLMVPLHYIHASYVRSHYNTVEMSIQDAPRPNEILFGLAMGTGGRVHARLGGLAKEQVSVHDGQR